MNDKKHKDMTNFDFQQTAPAIQELLNSIPDKATKEELEQLRELYEALTQSEIIPVPSADWPVSDPQENVIYRVAGTSSYTDYMWDGTDFIPMATYDNVPTDIPTVGSTDVITAGGVANHGSAFDISEYNKNGATLATYANLSAALAAVPSSVQKGGMSIKFVRSSDNKYVQYNLTSDSFNTNVFNWQRCYIDTICDVQLINECIKELYIRNNIDFSTAAWFRFFAGYNHHYGLTFYDSNFDILVEIDKRSDSDTGIEITSNPLITTNAGSAVLDWAKIQELCGTEKYVQFPISRINSVTIKNIEYSPYIKAYEQSADISVLNAGSILVSDNAKVNACIKELYINNQSIDPSLYPIVRLYYGSSNVYGIALFKTGFADVIELYGDSSYLESNIINHQNGFALVDWKKIQEICDPSNYIDIRSVSLSKYITDLHYWSSLYVLYSNLGNIPTYGSDKSVNSGKLYDDLFGSIPMDVYSASLIKVKGDGNLTFGYDSNGRVTATVGSDGIAANFYFGFRSSDIIFKANHKYKLIGLFLNNNFTLSALTGLLQVYADDGAGRLAQEVFALKVDGNYLYIEKELQFEHPFHVSWFCIYHPTNTSEPEGATLTYLDLKIIDSDISDKNTLEGVTFKRIKDISAEQIKAASSENYQHVIDVYPNNTPCQIANLIRGITDASATNRYKILVHDGDYAETDIVTKDYIDIEGVHYQGAKLIHDGNATYNSPDNYSLGSQYSNIPVNTIPWNYKHLIYHMSNSNVKNITLMTVGGSCKYICHQDSSSARFTAVFEHCNFVNGSGSQVLGVGANAEQFFKYIGCQFIDCRIPPYNRSSFNLHNWTNKDKPCGLHFEDCNFSHCGWINISELGSGQTDYFTFLNCVCDNPNFTYFKFNGITYTETPPSYSIILRVVGGNLGGIAVEESRQETKYMMQSQYITIVGNSNSIPFGTLLDKSSNTPAANANNGFIYKVSDTDNNSGMIVVNTYGVGVGLAVAGNYAQGDSVYINNGKFTKTPNGNIAGHVVIANNLSEEGYICVRAKD